MKIKSRFISGLQDQGDEQLMFEAGLQLSLTPYDGHSIKPLFLGIWPQNLHGYRWDLSRSFLRSGAKG